MKMSDIGWFLLGTIAGWAILGLAVAMGAITVTMLAAFLPLVLPVVFLLGMAVLMRYLMDRRSTK